MALRTWWSRPGGGLPLADDHREQRPQLRGGHVARMLQAAPSAEEAHPVNIRVFSAKAIVQIARSLTHLLVRTWSKRRVACTG
jgi:hypothetical protein